MDTYKKYPKIMGLIVEIGVRQADLAVRLGINPSLLNAFLRGRRSMPDGLEARIHSTLDLLESAERAADEARQRVLAGEVDD